MRLDVAPWLLVPAALAATAPSCGLAPHDEETPVFTGDGISGYREVGPVEFCIGRTALAPPSEASREIAVCVEAGRAEVPCAADGECVFPERCLCGRCAVQGCASDGLGCDPTEVCRQGRCTLQCATDDDCPPGIVCDAGGCSAPCSADADCRFGERCDELSRPRACRTVLCDAASPCPGERECVPLQRIGELHEPFLVDFAGAEHAYVEVRSRGRRSIFRTRPVDELRWDASPEQPVLEPESPDDAGQVGAPALVVEDGALVMYFVTAGGAAIGVARSTDGVRFARGPSPVLTAMPDTWESGRVGSPSVVDFGGARYLLYEGGDGAGIGVAKVAGGVATRLTPDAPFVAPAGVEDDVFWRGIVRVGTPHAVVSEGVVRIYLSARGTEGSDAITGTMRIPADPNDSIGLVTTRDFVSFDRFPVGPVFWRRTNLRAYLGEREPFVRLGHERSRMHFVSTDASGAIVSGVSVAATPE